MVGPKDTQCDAPESHHTPDQKETTNLHFLQFENNLDLYYSFLDLINLPMQHIIGCTWLAPAPEVEVTYIII